MLFENYLGVIQIGYLAMTPPASSVAFIRFLQPLLSVDIKVQGLGFKAQFFKVLESNPW